MPSDRAKRRRKALFRTVPAEPALVLRSAKGFCEAYRALKRQFDAGNPWLAVPSYVNGVAAVELYLKCLLVMGRGEIPKRARVHEPGVIFEELPPEYQERFKTAWDRVLGRPPAPPPQHGRKTVRVDDLDIQLHQMDDVFDMYRYGFEWDGVVRAFHGSIEAAIAAAEATIFELKPELAQATVFRWSRLRATRSDT
jgi:hypothetical protein